MIKDNSINILRVKSECYRKCLSIVQNCTNTENAYSDISKLFIQNEDDLATVIALKKEQSKKYRIKNNKIKGE